MTTTKILLASLTLLGAGWLPAQDEEQPLSRVHGPAGYAGEWAESLRSQDLNERRHAYEEVLAGAARSPGVRSVVEGWAASSDDVELAWTAELLLRELEAGARPVAPDSGPFGSERGFGDVFDEMERLFERPLGGIFFGDDLDGMQGLDGLFGRSPLRDLDQLQSGSGSGLSISMGPDGVKVEVSETVDGEEKRTTYEAESMEQLLEQHPELEDKLGSPLGRVDVPFLDRDGLDGRFGTLLQPDGRLFGAWPGAPRTPETPDREPGELRTDVLGVRVVTPENRPGSVPGVSDDLGLGVVQVMPGSLGEALGVRAGEVVVDVNGVEIRSPDDVRRALAARGEDEAVEVEVVGPDGDRRTRRWVPERRDGAFVF